MAQLTFDANTGVVVPETSAVRADLVSRIQEAFKVSGSAVELDCDPTTPMGQLIDALTAEIEAKNAEIAFLANQLSPTTATGIFLDQLAALYLIERKVSEPTAVTCTVTGLGGTLIPFGSTVQDTSGRQFRLLATEGITIGSNGIGEGTFYAVEHGAIAVAANTLTKIVSVVPGWDTVNNPTAGVLGRDKESDAELRERMKKSVSINARGSLSAIKSALTDIPGVLDCEVLENQTNQTITQYGVSLISHSIGVCIIGGSDGAIAEAIYRKKDEGCGTNGSTVVKYTDPDFPAQEYEYKIIRPTSVAFKIQLTCYSKSLSDVSKAKIKQALLNDFNGQGANDRVGMAETVYSNRFWAAVIGTDASVPLTAIEIGLGASPTYATSVSINGNQSPTMGADDITFVFTGA